MPGQWTGAPLRNVGKFVIPIQRQGLFMSLVVGIQGQKAYGLCKTSLRAELVVQFSLKGINCGARHCLCRQRVPNIYHSLTEGVPSAVEACTLLVNFQRLTSSSLIYFHLKKIISVQTL